MCPEREVVVLLASESCQVENDDELHAALVRAAELQEPLQLRAIRSLGALAFLAEPLEDVEPLTFAVLLTGLELRRETQVLGLILGADADVDDGADHGRQLTPIVGNRQGDRYARHFVSPRR